MDAPIPFNRPHLWGSELHYISQAHAAGQLAGDGQFTKRAESMLQAMTSSRRVLLTNSCTAALEMAALLADIGLGDEVIMPSFTFVSTANAFVLRGGVPVFVDIRADTCNIDEAQIEQAITPRTRAICVVHYAGVACEMDAIMAIAQRHSLLVIEDAAQGVQASLRGRPLGSIGHLGAFSFHETKNVISGEGGALLVNDERFIDRAEVIREKGTNRSRFFRGEVDKYTWVDEGSSFLPGEIIAAFLCAQLEHAAEIAARRLAIWRTYHEMCAPLEEAGWLRRPIVPEGCEQNGHMYPVLLAPGVNRDAVLGHMKARGVHAVFHYVPLHDSPAGRRFGRTVGTLPITTRTSESLIRLPLWLPGPDQRRVIDSLRDAIESAERTRFATER